MSEIREMDILGSMFSTASHVASLLTLFLSAPTYGQPFLGVRSATISPLNGVPQLLINGTPTPPLIFFWNDEVGGPSLPYLAPQVSAAAQNGVHIYSTGFHWPWLGSDPKAPLDWSSTDQEFQRFIDIDPRAIFIVRIRSEPPANWSGWTSTPPGDVITYQDGSVDSTGTRLSWGSQYFHDNSIANISNFVQHYESNPIGLRIIAYHVTAGSSGEWFGFGGGSANSGDYRTAGPDHSNANVQAFRSWLQKKYVSDAQLQQAWGRMVTINTAAIPVDFVRFPMHAQTTVIQAFYNRPAQQDWIDYSAFESDLPSQWILDIAHAVKVASRTLKLTAFFYGYSFDSYGSFGSHNRLDRLLASPDVDLICGPISYLQNSNFTMFPDRWYGGAAGYQALVDSVAAHGKLWINENDILSNPVPFPDTTFDFANRILQRDLASVLVHRAGTWWMDLWSRGPFIDPRLWVMMNADGLQNYQKIYAAPKQYLPEVAIIGDPNSELYVREDIRIVSDSMAQLRNYSMRSGVSTGYYGLDDFTSGLVPQCPVYVFANTFYLTDTQIAAINRRLDSEGALVIWQYAPGFIGPSSSGAGRTSQVTGISVVQSDGYTGTNGLGILSGAQWGLKYGTPYSPRLVVQDPAAVNLGSYYVDGKVSTAVKRVGSHTSIFVGDFILSSDFIRRAVQQAAVNVWTSDDSIVHTDGNLLVIHSGSAGVKEIDLPAGAAAIPMGGGAPKQKSPSLSVNFEVGDTLWFQLAGPRPLSPTIAPGGIVNSASYIGGSVAPGELVTFFGADLGPDTLAGLTTDWSNFVAYQAGGTKVTFDGVPAPMVYAVEGQISAIVPYSIAGRSSTQIRVYAGRNWSQPVDVAVAASMPGIFTENAGVGQAAALNGDNSYNSSENPAPKLSTVVLYATGEGQTNPAGRDGLPATQVYPKPQQTVSVTVGGIRASVDYAGAAPGFVAGVMQVNVTVPANAPSGNVPVIIAVGNASSAPGVTIAIR